MYKKSKKLNIIIIIFEISILLIGIVLLSNLSNLQNKAYITSENRFEMITLADELRHSSDDLTHFARTYVVTGDQKFYNQFNQTLKIRNGEAKRPMNPSGIYWDLDEKIRNTKYPLVKKISLQELMSKLPYSKKELDLLKESEKKSNQLVNLEIKAFNAMKGLFQDNNGNYTIKQTPNQQLAINLLHSKEYYQAKSQIMEPIDEFINILDSRTKGEIETLKSSIDFNYISLVICSIIFIAGNIIIFILLNKKEEETKEVLEKAIEQQTQNYQEIINKFKFATDNALAGFWEIDLETNKVHFSDGWFHFLGHEDKYFENIDTQKVMEKIIHKDDFSRVKSDVENYLSGKVNKYNTEFRILHSNGSYTWINALGAVYNNKFFGFHIDINDLKNANSIISEQAKMVSMGEMIGNIAHQWRQPLSVISSGATGMLVQKQFDSLSDEHFRKTCDTINENAQYLSKTIDDFKNFIKNDRKLVRVNLKDNIETFLNLVNPSFKRHSVDLILDLDESIELNSYPNELIQCFMNIFNNAKDALKSSPQEKKLIFINSYFQGDNIIIEFQDNAGGISEDILPRIFEPYFTTKHQSQGTGLGLSMTYKLIVEGMKGTLVAKNINFDYENESYQGAEFKIILPYL